jgi:NitT/TauT family transport system substrate-binding protein
MGCLGRALLGALLALAIGGTAQADEKIRIVYTSSSLFTPGFVAADKGFFAKHGLDVSFIATAINSNIPAALVSGSAEIGGPTTSVLVQAADGGIDIVAIAGTGLAYPGGTNEAAVARIGVNITKPQDYIGRRVGVPGMGVIMDIMFRNWLMASSVDPANVKFVEVSNPQQMDALRGGTVDAVVANDPQLFRLIGAGVGTEAGKFMDALPGPLPIIVYAVTKDYARTHRSTVLAFQAAHREGVAYVEQHPDEARSIMAQRLHLAPDVVKDMEIPKFQPEVSAEQIGIMVDMLRRQQQLQQKQLDPKDLVFH